MVELDALQRRTLIWAGLAVVLTAFDGSVLVLALPAIAGDFHARVPALSNLGSVLALGSIGALPLATLADRRGQAVSVLAVLSGIGTGITVLAYPVVAPHWRYLFLAGGVGLLAAPMIWTRLPEGRVWLGVRLSGSALRLLIAPTWRRRLIVIAATTALLAVLLEPAGLLFTLFASQVLHLSPAAISELIIVSGVAGAASYVAGGFLSDRFGRRAPGTALTGATAVAASLSFATGTPGFVAGNVLWSSFASAATPVLGAWSAELFPTRARATAEALSSLAAAAGSVAGLQAVGLISQSMSLGTALGLTGVVAFLGALLLLLLPETRGAPLPD